MRISIFIIILLSVVDIMAQNIYGRVMDEDASPLGYANVVLLTADSIFIDGTVTTDIGDFMIDSAKAEGNGFRLKVSAVGFEPICLQFDNSDVGDIRLRRQTNMLSEVVVTPLTYTMKGNGLVVSIQNSALSHMEDTGRMLEFIPGIQSGNDGLHVFGKGKPLVYINGRILYDLSELERLRPSDIATVEVISNSGAAYSSSSQAVVKIKTIRKKGDGLSMDFRSYFQVAHKMRFGETAQFNYRSDRFDIFGYLNYLHADDYETEKSSYDVKSTVPFILDNIQSRNIRRNRYTGKIGFDYYITQHHNLGAYYTYQYHNVDTHGRENVSVTESEGVPDRQTYEMSNGLTMPSHRLNAYYAGQADKVEIRFNNDFYWSANHQSQTVDGNSDIHGTQFAQTANRLRNRLIASDLSFGFQKDKSVWNIGLAYNHTSRTNDYESIGEMNRTENQKIEENKCAAYAEYQLLWKKWEIDAGLRYELYKYDYERDGRHIDGQSKTYSDIYPSLSISHPVGNANLNLSYSSKSQKPQYNALDGNIQYLSRNIYRGGNPELKPSHLHDVQIALMYKNLFVSADYIALKNPIYYTYRFYDEENVILATYDNYPKVNIFQAQASYSKKIGLWKPQLTVELLKGDYRFEQSGRIFRYDRPLFSFDFNHSFTFPRQWYVYLCMKYQTKGCDEEGLMKEDRGRIYLDVVKTWGNVTVDLLFNDVTRSYKESYSAISQACTFHTSQYYDTQNIQLTIRYSFNSTRSKYKGGDAAAEELNRM